MIAKRPCQQPEKSSMLLEPGQHLLVRRTLRRLDILVIIFANNSKAWTCVLAGGQS